MSRAFFTSTSDKVAVQILSEYDRYDQRHDDVMDGAKESHLFSSALGSIILSRQCTTDGNSSLCQMYGWNLCVPCGTGAFEVSSCFVSDTIVLWSRTLFVSNAVCHVVVLLFT